jgi:DUF1680 family protein
VMSTRRDVLKQVGCGWAVLSLSTHTWCEAVGLRTADAMCVLPPGSVKLEGYLERYIAQSIQHWSKSAVPYAALASFFKNGRPKIHQAGRYVELFATGEMWGKAVRSAALFYRYTGDPALRDLLRATVTDLLSMRRSNGTLSCSPVQKQPDGSAGDLWERTYVLLALDEYYQSVEGDSRVLQAMIEEADATLNQVGPAPKASIVELGWSRALVEGNNIESSTILEPILRLYKLTAYERYKDFARYIVEVTGGALHHRIFEEVLSGEDPVAVGGVYPKAYEMTSLFEGLAEYYRVTGNDRWRQACLQYFHQVIAHEITLIGNGGGDQPYHPNVRGEAWDNTAVEQTNPDIKRMMETCTGVTWMKFCHQILRMTAEPLAVDCIERYAYNGLIGAMKPDGDGFSYVNLLNGVKTDKVGWGTTIDGVYVTCCNLNGPEGLAYLPLVAVMIDAEGPVVNLFNAGTARISLSEDVAVGLKILTTYPIEGEVRIEVTLATASRFVVKLRIPSWSERTQLTVNGEEYAVTAGRYARIDRSWSSGDVILLRLDMRCRLMGAPRGLHEGSDCFRALMRGPIVLARDENIDARYDEPVDILETQGFVAAKRVEPSIPGYNMQFEVPTRSGPISVVDYSSVNSWQGKRVQTWLPMAGGAQSKAPRT